MDIYCPKCSEPWDMESIHEEIDNRHDGTKPDDYDKAYKQVKAEFYSKGCKAFTYAWDGDCEPATDRDKERAYIASALYSAFGDDLDGVASDMADLGW